MQDIHGKTAIVTGAASGIGLGITQALIAEGVNVAMLDVEEEALDAAVSSLGPINVDVQRYVVDVTARTAMAAVADDIRQHFGDVHILCNNAGVASGGPIDQLTYDDWDWCLGVNLQGVINGLQSFLPLITGHGGEGHIVNTASILGQVTGAGQAIYSAGKFAVVAISEAARVDLAPKNIGVSVLCPGMIATNIIQSKRNRPEELGATGSPMDDDAVKFIDAVFAAQGLAPLKVGEQVVHGIRNNRPYVFTHAGLREAMEARFQGILDSFDGSEAPGGSLAELGLPEPG